MGFLRAERPADDTPILARVDFVGIALLRGLGLGNGCGKFPQLLEQFGIGAIHNEKNRLIGIYGKRGATTEQRPGSRFPIGSQVRFKIADNRLELVDAAVLLLLLHRWHSVDRFDHFVAERQIEYVARPRNLDSQQSAPRHPLAGRRRLVGGRDIGSENSRPK